MGQRAALRAVSIIGSWATLIVSTCFFAWVGIPYPIVPHAQETIRAAFTSSGGLDYVLSVWTYTVDVLILVASNIQNRQNREQQALIVSLLEGQTRQHETTAHLMTAIGGLLLEARADIAEIAEATADADAAEGTESAARLDAHPAD